MLVFFFQIVDLLPVRVLADPLEVIMTNEEACTVLDALLESSERTKDLLLEILALMPTSASA